MIASISALGASLREMTTDHFEVTRLARQYGEDIMVGLERALRARADGLFAPGQVVDVRYQDIRHDLVGAVARIYGAIGLELTAEAEARMRAFLAAHPGEPGRQPEALLLRRHRPGRGGAAGSGPPLPGVLRRRDRAARLTRVRGTARRCRAR